MQVNPFDLIRRELEFLKSHINHLQEEMNDKYTSQDSKYILQKDINKYIGKLQDLKEDIRMLNEEVNE